MAKNLKLVLDYDAKSDVLYGSFGTPRPAISNEEGDEDILVRRDEDTDEIVGFTILNFAEHSREGRKQMSIPLPSPVALAVH